MMLDLCPHALKALRTARAMKRDGLWPVWVPQASPGGRDPKTCSKKRKQANACQLLKTISCALPTWWLWRGGCTRSLSEHGRETPLRPWYFVSRRGRVGRCQVCKSQLKIFSLHLSTAHAVTKGRSQAAFVRSGQENTRQIAWQFVHGAGWSSPAGTAEGKAFEDRKTKSPGLPRQLKMARGGAAR